MSIELDTLETELENPLSRHLDSMTALEIVTLINQEDQRVAQAVQTELGAIAAAAQGIAGRMARQGRLIYIGAGTSGRLGVLDASECLPTFGVPEGRVIGIIAGGKNAVSKPMEGAEDNAQWGADALRDLQLSANDAVVGIAASGRTPYVIGALQYAKQQGAWCVGLNCTSSPAMRPFVDVMISPIVGAEVLTGSTRMKAGTAQKMVLNMLSTSTMVLLGKVYGHWMIDLKVANEKLLARGIAMLQRITHTDRASAADILQACDGSVRTSVVCLLGNTAPNTARHLLETHGGHVAACLQALQPTPP